MKTENIKRGIAILTVTALLLMLWQYYYGVQGRDIAALMASEELSVFHLIKTRTTWSNGVIVREDEMIGETLLDSAQVQEIVEQLKRTKLRAVTFHYGTGEKEEYELTCFDTDGNGVLRICTFGDKQLYVSGHIDQVWLSELVWMKNDNWKQTMDGILGLA